MIYVKMIGRLGNQLFYYSIARAIQLEHPEFGKIAIIPDNHEYDGWGGLQLLDFNINTKEIAHKPCLSNNQLLIEKAFKVIRKIASKFDNALFDKITYRYQPLLNKFGIYCMSGSKNIPLSFNARLKSVYISGVWENPIYFNSIRSVLLDEIKPIKDILPHNINMFNEILQTNSVCLSIRKGDFLKAGNERFNVCSDQYYYKAVELLNQKLCDIKLFVFSDDIEWCKNTLHFDVDVYYENNKGQDPTWEKLRLMSACKYFIISNSSFSWWAQYLGSYHNKMVIAPKPWRENEYCDCLYDDKFILLNGKSGELLKETKSEK